MSSHHVVRDNQEPALMILGSKVSFGVVQELLEWSPMIIVDSAALDTVLPWGIKIDAVIYTPSELEYVMLKTEHQQPLQFIRRDETGSSFAAALQAVASKNYPAINVVCSEPEWNTIDRFSSQHTLVVHAEGWRWSFLSQGRVDKIVPAGTEYKIRSEEESTVHSVDGRIQIQNKKPCWLGERT